MENPEGWKKISETNGRVFNPDPRLPLNVARALDLMKEMAEALTIYNNTSNQQDLIVAAIEGRKILKKFMEWK